MNEEEERDFALSPLVIIIPGKSVKVTVWEFMEWCMKNHVKIMLEEEDDKNT